MPLETRGLLASYDRSRRLLEVFGPTKVPHTNRALLAAMLRIPEGDVRFMEPDVGGSFEMRINGEHGALVDDGRRLLAVPPQTLDQGAYVPSNQRYGKFVADTLGRIAAGRPPLVSLREFATATALVDRCYQRQA